MTIEVSAKKIDDAISQGLKQLGVSLDEVNVEVVEAGGLFRKAKVRLTLDRPEQAEVKAEEQAAPKNEHKKEAPAKPEKSEKPEAAEKPVKEEKLEIKAEGKKKPVQKAANESGDAKPKTENNQGAGKKVEKKKSPAKQSETAAKQEEKTKETEHRKESAPRKLSEEDKKAAEHALTFVKDVIEKMGFGGTQIETRESCEFIEITAQEGDDSLIIGRHGETLSALSYLAETCARAEKSHVNITVDCNGYRDRRAASLSAMARRRANECVAKHRKIKLEAMDRIDRRTIHNALTDDARVTTASEGKEPYRYVVIIPR
ncbi:MAG: KH domain-containing protein [Clostridiales bacterium]|nr:KH domain-containing protein [Clostridiales bacterium]